MIFHTNGFKQALRVASEVPFAIAATTFNVEFIIAMIHVVIREKGVAACMTPHLTNTRDIDVAVLAVEKAIDEHSIINSVSETGFAVQDQSTYYMDPVFWEPVMTMLEKGLVPATYGNVIDIVVPENIDDIGSWSMVIETSHGEYDCLVRRDCCNISPAWFRSDDDKMNFTCRGRCGAYSVDSAAYNWDRDRQQEIGYWNTVTCTIAWGIRDPYQTHMLLVDVNYFCHMEPFGYGLLCNYKMDDAETRSPQYVCGDFVFHSDYASIQDYALCARNCTHVVCQLSQFVMLNTKIVMRMDGDKGRDYFLSVDEMRRIRVRGDCGWRIPWQVRDATYGRFWPDPEDTEMQYTTTSEESGIFVDGDSMTIFNESDMALMDLPDLDWVGSSDDDDVIPLALSILAFQDYMHTSFAAAGGGYVFGDDVVYDSSPPVPYVDQVD
jgi:hypothetical protein